MIVAKQISDLLFSLYNLKGVDDYFLHVLNVLEKYIPSTLTGYSITDLRRGVLEMKHIHNVRGGDMPALDEVSRLAPVHPFLEYFLNNSSGPVLSTADIMSEEEWKTCSFFKQVHEKLGLVHDTSVRFYSGNECISFAFTDTHPMDVDLRRLLNLVVPHIKSAYHNFTLQQAGPVQGLPENMVVLTQAGDILLCPEPATEILENYFPRKVSDDTSRLPKRLDDWCQREMAREGRVNARKFSMRKDGQSLIASMQDTKSGFILVLEEMECVRVLDLLIDCGLTKREAEVMTWAAQGKQNSEIAVILDIREATVRKHMEHILQKLQCETRGSASQLVMQYICEQLPHAKCHFCTQNECQECID